MEGRKAGKNGNGRARAPDPLAQTGEVPPVPSIATPAAGAAGAVGPARRRDLDLDDDDGFGYRPLPGSRSTPPPVPRTAGPARARVRHWGILISFLLLVVAPVAVAGWYLWERASPRYASSVGFSVRTEEGGSALDALGGMIALGGRGLLLRHRHPLPLHPEPGDRARRRRRLDLRTLWSKGDPERDPVFAYHPPAPSRTCTTTGRGWSRSTTTAGTGLLDIEVQAFTPEDAQAIAQAIYEESQRLINRALGHRAGRQDRACPPGARRGHRPPQGGPRGPHAVPQRQPDRRSLRLDPEPDGPPGPPGGAARPDPDRARPPAPERLRRRPPRGAGARPRGRHPGPHRRRARQARHRPRLARRVRRRRGSGARACQPRQRGLRRPRGRLRAAPGGPGVRAAVLHRGHGDLQLRPGRGPPADAATSPPTWSPRWPSGPTTPRAGAHPPDRRSSRSWPG